MILKKLTALLFLLAVSQQASSAELVRDFSGSTTTTTASFTVDGPWLLDWRLSGEYDTLIALDIVLVEAKTGRHVGRVVHTKRKGNGLKLFEEPGTYQLRISTTLGRWRVKIKSIDEDEVELYSPRRGMRTPNRIE